MENKKFKASMLESQNTFAIKDYAKEEREKQKMNQSQEIPKAVKKPDIGKVRGASNTASNF